MKLISILKFIAFLGSIIVTFGIILALLSEQIGIAYIMIGGSITLLSGYAREYLKKTKMKR